MRKLILVLAVVLLTPALALATSIDVTGAADCDGWAFSGSITFSQFALTGDLTYSVVLFDDGGNVVATESGGGFFEWVDGNVPFAFNGMWGMELCGDFTVVGTVEFAFIAESDGSIFREVTDEFTDAFTCICDTPSGCFYTPGYWKNHEENWPVDSLTLGGVVYTQAELLTILRTPVRGDATIILAYHLIAAKLNVLSGADDTVGDTIMGADALLAMYPIGSKPGDPGRADILDHKDIMADYNEQGCEEDEDMMDSKILGLEKAAVEGATWGGLKSTFK